MGIRSVDVSSAHHFQDLVLYPTRRPCSSFPIPEIQNYYLPSPSSFSSLHSLFFNFLPSNSPRIASPHSSIYLFPFVCSSFYSLPSSFPFLLPSFFLCIHYSHSSSHLFSFVRRFFSSSPSFFYNGFPLFLHVFMFVTFSLLTVFCSFFISHLTSFLFPCIYSLHAFTSFVFFRFAFFIIMFPSLILLVLFVSQSFFLLSHLPLYHGFSLFKFVFFLLLSSFPPFALLTFPNFHLPLCISL